MQDIHHGGCLCGGVRFHTDGPPTWTTICHCTFCQRLTGSAFLVEPVFRQAQVVVDRGAVATYEHRSPAHGRTLTVQFCARCGTHLSLLFERFPGVQGVCGGSFDDPHWLRPSRHIFTQTASPWFVFPPGVACFRHHAIAEDGSAETPWQAAE